MLWCIGHAPCELEADFQQTYGLNIGGLFRSGEEVPPFLRLCALAGQLPTDARVRVKANPDAEWSLTVAMQAVTANACRQILNSISGSKLELIQLPSQQKKSKSETRKLAAMAMSKEELMEILNQKRGG